MEQNVARVNLMSKIGRAKHKVAIPIPPLSGHPPSSIVYNFRPMVFIWYFSPTHGHYVYVDVLLAIATYRERLP